MKELRLDEWRVPGFEFIESTTRVVRMVLNKGVSAEELHLFKFYNGSVLVVVPGRAPLFLRCRRRGISDVIVRRHAARDVVLLGTSGRTVLECMPVLLVRLLL